MFIRKSTPEDLPEILALYSDARSYMAENGNPDQWKGGWPPEELVFDDILSGDSYVCIDNGVSNDVLIQASVTKPMIPLPHDGKIVGTFFFREGPDPEYNQIYDGNWKDTLQPYCVVHRIATDRNTRGVGTFCLNWAYQQCPNIRIDTHLQNKPMQGLLAKTGFSYCGTIFLKNGESRMAFQKVACSSACIVPLTASYERDFSDFVAEYLPGSDVKEIMEKRLLFPHAVLMMLENEKLCGCAFGWATKREGEFVLSGIAVDFRLTRKGLGSGLLAEFEKIAAHYGFRKVSLGSAGGYVENFYLKNGYQPICYKIYQDSEMIQVKTFSDIHDYETYVRPPEDGFVVMEKVLRS